MKITGIIMIIFGGFGLIGGILSGGSIGGLFWVMLGAYLVHCANKKKKAADEA